MKKTQKYEMWGIKLMYLISFFISFCGIGIIGGSALETFVLVLIAALLYISYRNKDKVSFSALLAGTLGFFTGLYMVLLWHTPGTF